MNRRQLLRHTAWFGAAVGLSVVGGEVLSHVAGSGSSAPAAQPTLRFAQVSDSHIGFTGAANTDVAGSFTHAIDTVNNLGYTPDFVIHTGDLTHLATPEQFDQVRQMMTGLRTPHVFTVPGEHDSADDAGPSTARPSGRDPRRRLVQLRHRRGACDRAGEYAEPEEARAPRRRSARVRGEGRRLAVE
ncbi:calcineurin-like phosphoesterase family protein [Mycobacterium kansasii 824]|nr:calcineurin-like phosphoesterase family protein [Mycobacterium kansasii 824]